MNVKAIDSLSNSDLEADVVGGVMLASHEGAPLAEEVAGALGQDALTDQCRRLIWEVILELATAGMPHDGISVADRLKERKELHFAGGFHGVVGLMHDTSSTANLTAKAAKLREYANRRSVYAACRQTMEEVCHSDSQQAVAALSARLDAILASGAREAISFSSVMDRAEEQISTSIDNIRRGQMLGVPFGLPALDGLTGGMRPGELWGIAARTSVGKTAIANQIAVQAAAHGHAGLIVTLEESSDGIGLRAIANTAGIDLGMMRSGKVSLDVVTDATVKHNLRRLPLWVDTRTFDLRSIISRIAQYRRKHRIAFAIVDHIGLIRVPQNGGQRRYEAIGDITRGLKQAAMQFGLPVIALIQVGRDSEKEGRRPMLSDLRESGNIEQDLNGCVALQPLGPPNKDGGLPLQVGLIKNRYGSRCWLKDSFEFQGSIQRLVQTSGGRNG